MEINIPGDVAPPDVLDRRADSRDAVTTLYQEHAVGLIRLAVVMLGDRAAAEEVVQEAFCGLYRHWSRLSDPGKALGYARSAVLNGCRSALRRRARWQGRHGDSLAVGVATGVQVFSVATGAKQAWSTPALGTFPYGLGTGATNGMLAWQDDHTLAFVWDGLPKAAMGVRFLDTSAPGKDGLADSRLVQPMRLIGNSYWRQVLPTANGRKLLTVLQVQGTKAYPHLSLQLAVCSARTGKILRILNRVPAVAGAGDYEQVLWASPAGDTLIVAGTQRVRPPSGASFFLPSPVVLTSGHTRRIPWSNRTIAAAW